MKTNFTYKGYWYLPESPDKKVAGILEYHPNKSCILELIGGFDGADSFINSLMNKRTRPIIYGENSDSKKITLINCIQSGSYNFSSSFPLTRFTVNTVVVGIHLADANEKVFYAIEIDVPLLKDWGRYRSLKESITFNSQGRVQEMSYRYALNDGKKIKTNLNRDTTLTIAFGCDVQPQDEFSTVLRNRAICYIEETVDHSYTQLLEKAYQFRTFIELATKSSLNYNYVYLYNKNVFQKLESGEIYEHPVSLYFNEYFPERLNSNRQLLFDLPTIEAHFQNFIIKWFEADNDMAPLRKHLIESIAPNNTFNSLNFLVILQSLDGFHRRFRNQKQVKFKDRLKGLAKEFVAIKKLKITNDKIDRAIDSRDYYSHFFHKNEKAYILDGVDLYDLTQDFRQLLTCCILKETGFNDDLINDCSL